jgi:hypothetical protein
VSKGKGTVTVVVVVVVVVVVEAGELMRDSYNKWRHTF